MRAIDWAIGILVLGTLGAMGWLALEGDPTPCTRLAHIPISGNCR
jgi:hypothetical protein